MNTGFQLHQLQEIDTSIEIARKRIADIDTLISNNDEILLIQREIKYFEEIHKKKYSETNQLANEIEMKKIKMGQSESSLYAGKIQNPKELQDLQLEISSLGQSIRKMEDDLLEKMIDLDEIHSEIIRYKEKLSELEKSNITRNSLLDGEKTELKISISNLLEKRKPIASQIEESLLTIYDNLRRSKNGTAISRLLDESCSSCGYSLTANQCQIARSAIQLFYCPSCGRIIYGS